MVSGIAISVTDFKQLEDEISFNTCLPQEQFEEYIRDKHVSARAWHN